MFSGHMTLQPDKGGAMGGGARNPVSHGGWYF